MGFFGKRKSTSPIVAPQSARSPSASLGPRSLKAAKPSKPRAQSLLPPKAAPLSAATSAEVPPPDSRVDLPSSANAPVVGAASSPAPPTSASSQHALALASLESNKPPTPPAKGGRPLPLPMSSPHETPSITQPPAAHMPGLVNPQTQPAQPSGISPSNPGGSTKSRPGLSHSSSDDHVDILRAQALSRTRPMSFLSFLGGGGAHRASILTASNAGKLAKTTKGLSAKSPKAIVMDAELVNSGPSKKRPSRVVAVVGDVRTGLGRMIVEELVRTKTIVVALTDAHDGQFGKDLESLALSPSLFHAFPIPALFGSAFVPLDGGVGVSSFSMSISPGASTPSLSWGSTSTPSLPPMGLPPPGTNPSFKSLPGTSTLKKKSASRTNSSDKLKRLTSAMGGISAATQAFNERHACLIEMGNIFKSYRVDTVICIFSPRESRESTLSLGEGTAAGSSTAPSSADLPATATLPQLSPSLEKARVEEMERVCLQAAVACGAGRFATCSWTPSPFGPPVSSTMFEPPDYVRRAPLSSTLFRWGMLMNELAATVLPNDRGETALGKWLHPPSERSGRKVVDVQQQVCYLPETTGKGKSISGGVSLTLAEDVARFVSLACKLKGEWDWSTGTMVGERVRGGWEEIIDMLDTTCRVVYRREYLKPFSDDSSSASSSTDHLSPHSNGIERHDSQDSSSISSVEMSRSRSLAGRARSPVDIDDVLRGQLAAEGLDASSVRLGEFFRVWFTPKSPSARLAPPMHSPRNKRSLSHMGWSQGVGGGNGGPTHQGGPNGAGGMNGHTQMHSRASMNGTNGSERRHQHGPPPSRSSGAGQVGQVGHVGHVGMTRGQTMPPAGQSWVPVSPPPTLRINGPSSGAGSMAGSMAGATRTAPVSLPLTGNGMSMQQYSNSFHSLDHQPHQPHPAMNHHHHDNLDLGGRIPTGHGPPIGRSPLAQRVA